MTLFASQLKAKRAGSISLPQTYSNFIYESIGNFKNILYDI